MPRQGEAEEACSRESGEAGQRTRQDLVKVVQMEPNCIKNTREVTG